MANPTGKRRSRKVSKAKALGVRKPYPEFPLFATPHGYWAKKIRGVIRHFGRWGRVVNGTLTPVENYEAGWQDALEKFKAEIDDFQAGRTPRLNGKELTVKALGDRFLTAKNNRVASGELGPRMFAEYRATCQLVADTFGKDRRVDDLAAEDFERLRAKMAERWGPVRLSNEIGRVKSVFKYAMDNGLIERPVRFGSEFKKPGKAVLRRHKNGNGGNMMEADEIRKLLDAASNGITFSGVSRRAKKPKTYTWPARPDLKAQILLMVNCGFGPMDLATLPLSAVNLNQTWIDFPRPKTGIERRCPLWPETTEALRAWLAVRPKAREAAAANLVFLTARGRPCISGHIANPITILVTNLMKAVGVHKEGRGPYTLRHVFRTVADEARDTVAIDLIMGHSDPTMGGHYRERIDNARLVAVSEHVRKWLFSPTPKGSAS
jgi:integrase